MTHPLRHIPWFLVTLGCAIGWLLYRGQHAPKQSTLGGVDMSAMDAALARRIPEVWLENATIFEVANELSQLSGVAIVVDPILRDRLERFTLSRRNATFESLLDEMIRQTWFPDHEYVSDWFMYSVSAQTIRLTTYRELELREKRLLWRIYDVPHPLARPPSSWQLGTMLVVSGCYSELESADRRIADVRRFANPVIGAASDTGDDPSLRWEPMLNRWVSQSRSIGEDKLRSAMQRLKLDEVTAAEALQRWARQSGADLVIDAYPSLPQGRFSVNLAAGPAWRSLAAILAATNALAESGRKNDRESDFDWFLDGAAVTIFHVRDLGPKSLEVRYDIRNLMRAWRSQSGVNPYQPDEELSQRLINWIEQTIAPATWRTGGISARVELDQLYVSQTWRNQEDIRDLLATIRGSH